MPADSPDPARHAVGEVLHGPMHAALDARTVRAVAAVAALISAEAVDGRRAVTAVVDAVLLGAMDGAAGDHLSCAVVRCDPG